MTKLLTAAQMRAVEQAAIDSGHVTGLELMERAGLGVVEAIFEEWPELTVRGQRARPPDPAENLDKDATLRAIVLCGPGNNGGDGFVVARLLKARGWAVAVYLLGDPARLPPDARINFERWQDLEEVRPFSDVEAADLSCVDLTIDALFGTGLTRPLPDDVRRILAYLTVPPNAQTPRPRLVAIDILSGFDADSGRELGVCHDDDALHVWPALTVTFETAKIGHLLAPLAARHAYSARPRFGQRALVVKPIGLAAPLEGLSRAVDLVQELDLVRPRYVELLGETSVSLNLLELEKDPLAGGHKFSHGHALVLTGSAGKTGAARLAARGALRIGAGLVTLGVPEAAHLEVASQVTAVMLQQIDDDAGLTQLLEDRRLNALCLGPGLGLTDDKMALVAAALRARRATVLDADALTLLASHSELAALLHPACVLTPHMGEFRRLFPAFARKLDTIPQTGPAYSKIDATREAAAQLGCTVLLKGPDTVIADPDGRCSINSAHYDRAAPWLATAGSGDVLAGFVTGLLARGFAPMQAAETGAWLHVECARGFGPGLIAEDLPEELPKVFRALGA